MTRTVPLDIVYRDEQLVAINKPAGLLVHRSPIDRHETRFAVQMLRDQIGQFVYPLHRLDKPTSGLLLFALDQESARRLSGQFSDGSLSKRYLAIVRGHCIARADIEHPLRDETDHRGRRCDDGALREASTTLVLQRQWRLPMPVDRYPEARYSLVELSPHTGRHRQLRRHMKHIAHPIIGDVRYGKGSHNRFFRDHFQSQRLLLAAVSVDFKHPVSGSVVRIDCPPAHDFQRIVDALDALQSQPGHAEVIDRAPRS